MSFAKDIGKTVTGFLGATGRAPQIKAPTFGGVRTPSLILDPSGVLSRRPGAGQRVPSEEATLLDTLSANRAGIRGLAGNIPGIRSQLDPLKARGAGFFGRTADLTRNLTGQLDELRPGFGRLTESRVQGVRGAASKAIGNLRTSFSKRNVAGSSFANQQIASIQQDFANEEDRVRAESFIQEQQAQQQIIAQIGGLLQLDQASLNQQATLIGVELGLTEAEAGLFAREIQNIQVANSVLQTRIHRELNELNLASGTITQVLKIASDVAVQQATLEAEHAKGQGKSLASGIGGAATLIGGLAGGPVGAAVGSLLGGSSGSVASATGSGVIGSLGAGTAAAFSDRRVKKNIRKVGTLDNGLPVYAYEYKAGGPPQIGLMAQDVEKVRPEAVGEIHGIKHVNYDKAVV